SCEQEKGCIVTASRPLHLRCRTIRLLCASCVAWTSGPILKLTPILIEEDIDQSGRGYSNERPDNSRQGSAQTKGDDNRKRWKIQGGFHDPRREISILHLLIYEIESCYTDQLSPGVKCGHHPGKDYRDDRSKDGHDVSDPGEHCQGIKILYFQQAEYDRAATAQNEHQRGLPYKPATEALLSTQEARFQSFPQIGAHNRHKPGEGTPAVQQKIQESAT